MPLFSHRQSRTLASHTKITHAIIIVAPHTSHCCVLLVVAMKTHGALPPRPLSRLLLVLCCLLAAFPSRQRGGMVAASKTRSLHSSTPTTAPTCVPLKGIESNATGTLDPAAYLDLDAIKVFLEEEPFNLDNPIIPTVAECSAGLETPISMRNLLGASDENARVVPCTYILV